MNLEIELLKGIDYSDNEEHQKAIDIFSELLRFDTRFERAYFERAMSYLNENKDNLALIDLEKLYQLNPNYPGVKDWLSKTFASLGDYKASADLKLADLKDYPNGKYGMGISPQSWADCANAFYQAGEIETAEELLQDYYDNYSAQVLKYRSYETAPSRILIKILLESNRVKQALQVAIDAMKSKHKKPADYELYIESLIINGHYDAAEIQIDSYTNEVQDGYVTDTVMRLKSLIPKS